MSTTSGIELASVADALAALDHATGMIVAGEVAQARAIAAVCDLHRVDEAVLVEGCERWVPGGADGTPKIGEFIAAEIGALLGVSPGSAMVRIARVLNVRHRHPVLWASVLAGDVRFHEAARVADACAQARLDARACGWVDRQCAVALLTQPWARVRNQIDGWILMADPALAAERATQAAEARRVGIGAIVDGHCDLWGRLDAADAIAFDQALAAIAQTLPADEPDARAGGSGGDGVRPGEPEGRGNLGRGDAGRSLDHRRAAAVGVLARQALGQAELPRAAEIIVRIDATVTGDVDGRDESLRIVSATGYAASGRLIHPDHRDETPRLAPVATVQGWGSVLAEQLRDLLSGCKVTVRPVVDARTLPVARGYQIPDAMRLAVTERWPVDAFPYGMSASTMCDLDHSKPYGAGGRTEVGNLAPLKRFGHRVRTHGGWRLDQSAPGVLTWTSPHGYTYATTPSGTIRIGRPSPREHRWWQQEPPDWLDHEARAPESIGSLPVRVPSSGMMLRASGRQDDPGPQQPLLALAPLATV